MLNEKIENHNLKVYLRPKIDVEDYGIVNVEALIYYRNENGAIIAPDKFIPVLGDTCLINKIDYYVLEKACETLNI